MAIPVWMDNLIAYSLQMAILASAGTLLAYLFRFRVPRVCFVYWQILLLACLILPAFDTRFSSPRVRLHRLIVPSQCGIVISL